MNKIFKLNGFVIPVFIMIFMVSATAFSQQYWQKIAKPVNRDLSKCWFVDSLNGWAIGDSGTIIHTSNGGYNWVMQNAKVKGYMQNIFFLNKRLGWALAWGLGPEYYGSYILRTTNGGNVWDTASYVVPDVYIRTIFFQDSLYGFMGGNPAILLRTSNAGASWDKCSMDSSVVAGFPVNKFRFFSQNYGIACGGIMDIAGVIWTTTNRGLYWSVKPIAPEPINDVHFFDSLNILALAGDFEYGTSQMRTSNGGVNWSYENIGVFGIPYTMAYRTNTEAWCPLGYIQSFLRTTNSGYNWSLIETPDTAKIFDLQFLGNHFGIGVGLGGNIIKYNPDVKYTVSGTVRYNDNNQTLSSGIVKAFKLNKTTGGIIYVDSAHIQPNGTYSLTNVPQDSVDIGVFPNSTPPNDWVITYYPSTINWQNAAVIYPVGNLGNIDISVFRLVSSSSGNSINGKVMQLTASMYAGIKDAFVYVKNGNTFVKTGITDSAGVYHLQSLPAGNLKVIINRLGFTGDSTMVNVPSSGNVDSVNFYLNRIFIGINPIVNNIPSEYKLYQNYPNPFNPVTSIRYKVESTNLIRINVFDILGKDIAVLVNEIQKPGEYQVIFNGINLPSGVYFYSLYADGLWIDAKKMLMIK